MWDNLIVFLGEKFGGAWIAKGLTALAVLLVSHGYLDAGSQTHWVQTNLGVFCAVLTSLLTWWRDRRKNQVVAIASTNQRPEGLPLVQPSVLGLDAAKTPDVVTTPTFNGPSRVTF